MDVSQPLVRALLHPFDRDLLDLPGRAFLLRAQADPALLEWRGRLVCQQGFKPAHDRLVAAGFTTVASLAAGAEPGPFDTGLVLLSHHKGEARAQLVQGLAAVAAGGLLVAAGANSSGAASLQKEAAAAFGLVGALSKHQARVFWLRAQSAAPGPVAAGWLAAAAPCPVGDTGLVARAGCFSPDHVDPGSALLAAHLPADLAGIGADLGAGWGFLAARVLAQRPKVERLDLFEAEALAVDDARVNLAGFGPRARLLWHDVRAGLPPGSRYDFIVTNPPFHDGARADPAIGQDFIAAAAAALRPRGRLVLVANVHLPYEAGLRQRFARVDLLAQADGFKVLVATR